VRTTDQNLVRGPRAKGLRLISKQGLTGGCGLFAGSFCSGCIAVSGYTIAAQCTAETLEGTSIIVDGVDGPIVRPVADLDGGGASVMCQHVLQLVSHVIR